MLRQVGKRERDSLLEAMGHVTAMVTWPMQRTGQGTVQEQVLSSKPQGGERFLCSPGFILVPGGEGSRFFLRMTN